MSLRPDLSPDPVLSDIRQRLFRDIPECISMVLIGSRAVSPKAARQASDYDIVAVVPTVKTPLLMPRLKRIESSAASTFDLSVTLNPLPYARLRWGKGNLMILKLGAEGAVIHGRNVIPVAQKISPSSIGQWWYFFFLASQAKRLLEVAPNAVSGSCVTDVTGTTLTYNAGKAVLGCAELILLSYGEYSADPQTLESRLADLSESTWSQRTKHARHLLEGVSSENPIEAWENARSILLECVDGFSTSLHGVSGFSAFSRAFLKSGGKLSRVRDIQFTFLRMAARQSIRPRVLLDRGAAAERVKLSLFLLLRAWSEGIPDEREMLQTRRVLSSVTGMTAASDGWTEWRNLLEAVKRCYPQSCVALGI